MTDNELSALIRSELLSGLARHGYSSVKVLESYQPTTRGRVSGDLLLPHF